ncbi:hypothetical protein SynROS8604_01322 [Synechococcus sp. ROS8604]|nr:hypothetical protein SynROS8604_01322 [Synechococcus sp. ROS8604]
MQRPIFVQWFCCFSCSISFTCRWCIDLAAISDYNSSNQRPAASSLGF